jgi:hypothetical protein
MFWKTLRAIRDLSILTDMSFTNMPSLTGFPPNDEILPVRAFISIESMRKPKSGSSKTGTNPLKTGSRHSKKKRDSLMNWSGKQIGGELSARSH